MPTSRPTVPIGDLRRQAGDLRETLLGAIERVIRSGWYILGEEGRAFEKAWAYECGATEAIGCANGTDAITLALLALGIEKGDEVVIPALTAVPTATGVIQAGARPVLADVDPDTALLTAETVERVLTARTRAIVAVHLYGQSCKMAPLRALADRHGLRLIEDAAQAHGARDGGEPIGTRADAACFSFYPSKNLGALGDGGAVVTRSSDLAERCRRARNYGQRERYNHVEYGINSRLDELQAAILAAKLPKLSSWNDRRRWIATQYDAALAGSPLVPVRNDQGGGHVYHLYVVQCKAREKASDLLRSRGVETAVHYPRCLASQPGLASPRGEWRNAEKLADQILTIPLFPELTDDEVERVGDALKAIRDLS